MPGLVRRWVRRHGRFAAVLAAVLGLLVTTNLLRFLGPAGTGLVLGPIVAVGLVVLARRSGLSWDDLGLARRTWVRGAAYAAAAVAAVLALYAVGMLVPLTRSALLDARYHLPVRSAVLTALLVIPVGTVLLEEVAFRGVLQALVTRHRGVRWGLGVSSVVFGGWHVLPSLGLHRSNEALGHLLGSGPAAQAAVVAGVVVFTAVAGLLLSELRRRSGSLLAAAGLHWATNGVGVLAVALAYAAFA